MQVAKTILEQLGGAGRLQVMTGAYNFVAYPNGVSFKFKNRKVNYVKITLNGKDLYDIEFLKLTVNSQKKVAEFEDIYFDQLIDIFEDTTGMYLRLFAKGGRLKKDENIEMIFGQLKQIHHHEKELRSIIKKDKSIEPWVIAKLQRATTDLADVTHYEDNKTTKYAKGGYLEGREEYEGFQYQIWYNQNKGMYSVSDNLGIFKGDNEYFKKYDQAKEHAEMSIRSMLEKGEEYAKGGGVGEFGGDNVYYVILNPINENENEEEKYYWIDSAEVNKLKQQNDKTHYLDVYISKDGKNINKISFPFEFAKGGGVEELLPNTFIYNENDKEFKILEINNDKVLVHPTDYDKRHTKFFSKEDVLQKIKDKKWSLERKFVPQKKDFVVGDDIFCFGFYGDWEDFNLVNLDDLPRLLSTPYRKKGKIVSVNNGIYTVKLNNSDFEFEFRQEKLKSKFTKSKYATEGGGISGFSKGGGVDVFPKMLKFEKEIYSVGVKKDFGAGLGQTQLYEKYHWQTQDSSDKIDFINKGWVLEIIPESIENNYAEYKLKGGSKNSIRGFSLQDIQDLKRLKAITEEYSKGGGIGKKIVVNTYKGKIEYTNQEIQEMIDDIDMYWDADNLPKWIYITGKAGHPDFPKNKKQVIEVLSEIKNSKNDVYINVSSKEPYYTHIIKMAKGGGVGNINKWEKGDITVVNGENLKRAEVVPSYKDDRMRGAYFVVFRDENKKIIESKDNFESYNNALKYAMENVNKMATGGGIEDDITRAKSKAIDKIDFEYYAKKHAGDSWNTMSKQEKAELMSELRDNWFNDSYAKGGNIYNYLVGTDFKYLGELHKVKKVEKYPTYTILVTTENRRFRMDVLQEQGVKFADKPERKKRQPETAEQKRRKNAFKIKQLQYERKQLLIDMEEEAEPEGGPIANRYGRMLNKIDKQIAQLSGKDSFATGGNIEEEVSYIENRIYNLEQLKQVAGEDEQNYYSRLIQDLEREKSELLNKTSSEVPENKKKFWFFKDGGNLDSEKPIIYIEDFDAIYSGKSYGQWLDLSKFDSGQEVMEALSDIASNWSKRKGEKIETISVTDYENIPRSLYHEFMSSKDYDFIIKAYKVSKQVNIPMWVVGDVMNDYSDSFEHTLEGIKEFIEENYLGFAEDDSDLAYDYIEKNGGIKSLAEEMIKRNFDYEKYGRDVRLGMDSEQEEELGYDKLDDYDLGKELVEQYSDIRELDEKTLKSNFNYKLFGDYLTSFYANYGGHYFRN